MRSVHSRHRTRPGIPRRPLVVGRHRRQRMRVACGATQRRRKVLKENWTHLEALEAESIYIIREVVAQFRNPVLLYSIGKDSSVLVHLARKAFYPVPLPFPFLHIDTG